jgi:Tol biopolymer transport system component
VDWWRRADPALQAQAAAVRQRIQRLAAAELAWHSGGDDEPRERAVTDSTERLSAALVGRYRVLRRLGEGGMALVYLAEDLKHGRQVALKVLRPELAQALGPERFLREIAIAARLTHPNILPLLDSGEAEGTLFYVMPYVAGESLRDRLVREGQLPVDEAVRLVQRVALALGYAHGLGVIHRDIKPENILLSGGEPVVTDFGIAKAVSAAGQTKLTETGFAVGTAAYMSPEQASAEAQLDGRSDLYGLGVVLYELLAGAPPFTGPTVHAITARKLTEPVPPLRTVRETVPVAVEQVVFKALAKLPADRFASAQQLADALEAARASVATPRAGIPVSAPGGAEPSAGPPHADGMGASGTHSTSPGRRWRSAGVLMLAAVAGAGAGALLVWRHFERLPRELPVTRFAIQPPKGDSIVLREPGTSALDISPDGRLVVYMGAHGSDTVIRLYVRDLVSGTTTVLAGTEGADRPFFKPDGTWIGYFQSSTQRLMKIPTQGGQPQPICDCGLSFGGDWGEDGWIVLDPSNERSLTGLLRVRETGGRPEKLPVADSTFSAEVWALVAPHLLPGGKVALVTATGSGSARVSAISLATGQRTDLVTGGAWGGRYVEPGFLVYAKALELWAVRFDARRLRTFGEPIRVLDSMQAAQDGWAEYAFSRSGTLVYSPPLNASGHDGVRLVWVDGRDRIEPVAGVPAGYWLGPRLSPDNTRIVWWGFPYGGTGGGRVYVFDRSHGAPRAVTDDAYTSAWPIFTRDGRGVVSNSNREQRARFPLYLTPVAGGGSPQRITTLIGEAGSALMQQPSSFTPDGAALAFQQGFDPRTGYDIYVLSLSAEHSVRPLLATKANEHGPAFSPDGRWLAYVSDESGRFEVYVRPYPALDQPVQVTREGGDAPMWSPDGREIYFARGEGIFAVPFTDGRTGEARQLIDRLQRGSRNALDGPSTFGPNYDVARDGRLLTVQMVSSAPNGAEYQVVLNWFTELRQRFAAKP